MLSAVEPECPPACAAAFFGAMTAAAGAAMPLGVLVAGSLLVRTGLRRVLLAVGGCYLIATLSTHPGAARDGRGVRIFARDLPRTRAKFLNFLSFREIGCG
jgi:hypothetical protein